MIEKFTALKKDHLDKLPMNEPGRTNWYYHPAGQEHYRLLKAAGFLYQSMTMGHSFQILELGSQTGCSALALANNLRNHVISYDFYSHPMAILTRQSNLEFRLGSVLDTAPGVIAESQFIFIDTFHNGDFERRFFDHLENTAWKGIVLLDDIHLNPAMEDFWRNIKQLKSDITHIGHWSGTGVVEFFS